jgi:adenine-specific DNA methylase
MIPKDCKRLAEVDFPIAEVSRHAAKEKAIRHGHPNTVHLWWARRPLASSRAVLLGLLLPDPCDSLCPKEFKQEARNLLRTVAGCNPGTQNEDLRRALLTFIADFSNWDLAKNRAYLDVSRALVKAAHGDEPPLVADPFAGGGSIPLEALRVGCDAFASDLNPVACLILKVMLEDTPRHGPKFAAELRQIGAEIKKQADRELADVYPKDADGVMPIAYLWARTVRCESPNCGAEIPLMRSLWLCKKASRRRALRHRVVRPKGEAPCVEFEVFEPIAEKEVSSGTVTRAKATCVCCGVVLPPERVRAQLIAQSGGADVVFDRNGLRTGGARILAVVTLRPGDPGRHYRLPTQRDYAAVHTAQTRIAKVIDEWERAGKQGLSPVPNELLPLMSGTFNVPLYGINRWGDLFSARQKLALVTLARLVSNRVAEADRESIALAVSKLTELACSICSWEPIAECPRHIFGRQAIPIAWDFSEGVLTSSSSGSFEVSLENAASGIDAVGPIAQSGTCQLADGRGAPAPRRNGASLVYRSAILFRGSLCGSIRLLLRLAQAGATEPSLSARSLRSRKPPNTEGPRNMRDGTLGSRSLQAQKQSVLRGRYAECLRRGPPGSARGWRRLRRVCSQHYGRLGGSTIGHDPWPMDDNRLLADCH